MPFKSRHACVLWWDFVGPFYRYSVWTEGLWQRVQIKRARRNRDFQRFMACVMAE